MSCKSCQPCKQGLPCSSQGIRRITNWGSRTLNPIDAWLAAGGEDHAQLAQIIDESYFAEQDGIHGYDELVALGVDLKAGTISQIEYLNKTEELLKEAGSTSALLDVTTVLTHYRKRAIMIGGGAMIAGIALSGSVSMTNSKTDDYAHMLSLVALGYGSFTLAKAYGVL
jgi:hypothetical protein